MSAPNKAVRANVHPQTTPLQLQMTVVHVWGADIRAESFRCTVRVDCRWRCPEDAVDEAMANGADVLDVEWRPDWVPRLTVLHTTAVLHNAPARFRAERDSEGVCWINSTETMSVEVAERFDLRMFPFDVQDFNIRLRVDNARTIEPILAGEAGPAPLAQIEADGSSLPDLVAVRQGSAFHRVAKLGAELHAALVYQRVSLYYSTNFLLPFFAITSCCLAAWSIHWHSVGSRLSLDVTLLLTTAAFKQSFSASLQPPVAYLTLLDTYALGAAGFLVLAVLMHATVGFMLSECDSSGNCLLQPNLAARIDGDVGAFVVKVDEVMLGTYGVLWLAWNALYMLRAWHRLRSAQAAFSPASAKKSGFSPARVCLGFATSNNRLRADHGHRQVRGFDLGVISLDTPRI